MKVALYVEDGVMQIVLTPVTEFEKSTIKKLEPTDRLTIRRGSFYECRGGWYRHSWHPANSSTDDDSLILIVGKAPERDSGLER